MAIDTGYRSVEVHLVNNTKADLSVQAVTANGANSAWISGEAPTLKQVVPQWGSIVWGVLTQTEIDSASGSVTLVGYGNGAIYLNLINHANGTSSVTANSNDQISAVPSQIDDDENNHPVWQVVLSQQLPTTPTTAGQVTTGS